MTNSKCQFFYFFQPSQSLFNEPMKNGKSRRDRGYAGALSSPQLIWQQLPLSAQFANSTQLLSLNYNEALDTASFPRRIRQDTDPE